MKRIIAGLLAALTLSCSVPMPVRAQVAAQSILRTGPETCSDGQNCPQRAGKSGDAVESLLNPFYFEQAYRGNLFHLTTTALTVASAHVSASALGTIKFIVGFYNPTGSGKNAVIVDATAAATSGTSGGPFLWNFYCGINVTSTATGTIYSGVLNNNAGASSMSPQSNVVVATTPASTPNALVFGLLGGSSATAAATSTLSSNQGLIEGKIIVPPGCAFGLTATGAGTSHIVNAGLSWIELPI